MYGELFASSNNTEQKMDAKYPQPFPEVGEWIQAKRNPNTWITLWGYRKPTGQRGDEPPICFRYDPGQFLGPIHDYRQTDRYTEVLVPNPEGVDSLIWVEIWRKGNSTEQGANRGIKIATLIKYDTVAQWQRNGWTNNFVSFHQQ